jgi:hypothetical protein
MLPECDLHCTPKSVGSQASPKLGARFTIGWPDPCQSASPAENQVARRVQAQRRILLARNCPQSTTFLGIIADDNLDKMWYNSSVIRNLAISQPSSQPAVVREEVYEINEGRFSQVGLGKVGPFLIVTVKVATIGVWLEAASGDHHSHSVDSSGSYPHPSQ